MKIEWSCSIIRGRWAIVTTQRPRPKGQATQPTRARVVFAHRRASSSHRGSMLSEARDLASRVKTEPPQTHAPARAKKNENPAARR